MIRNIKALAADLARYNAGVYTARATYALEQAHVKKCKCGAWRPIGGRCVPCDAEKNRQWRIRNRKKP